MIRLPAGPHLVTAAVFVTAVAVVLNPVIPTLPDITVPALAIPAESAPSVPAPQANLAAPIAVPAARPALVAPVAAASFGAIAAAPQQGVVAQSAPLVSAVPPAVSPIASAPMPDAVIEIGEPSAALPTIPAVRAAAQQEGPWLMPAYAGDRQRVVPTRQRWVQIASPAPLPAAAADAPDVAAPGDSSEPGTAKLRGPREQPRSDAAEPGPQKKRGQAGPSN